MKEIYNKIDNLCINGILDIPENIKNIRLDVGLSYSAPNSKLWLQKSNNTIVYGFEPLPSNIENIIKNHGLTKNPNYKLINMALDDISIPTYEDFYVTDEDPGCSSLFKPTSYLPYKIKDVIKVPVISLKYFLDRVPWNRFSFIEMLKLDTQGKDFNILNSIKDYLQNIVYINVETTTFNHYEKSENNAHNIHNLLVSNNFECINETISTTIGWNGVLSNEIVDKKYLNKSWKTISTNIDSEVV